MKRTILVCLISSLFALVANAETSYTSSALSTSPTYANSNASIPGGVVWSDGTHAIYYDLHAKTETNLTGDMKGAVAKWPVAASANGEWLMWHQGGKFWTRQLPKGAPYAITYSDYEKNKVEKPFLWQNPIGSLKLSPNGYRFGFETVCEGGSWELAKPGAFGNPPYYAWRNNSFVGIFYLSTFFNTNHAESLREHQIWWPLLGNLVTRPPVPFMSSVADNLKSYDEKVSGMPANAGQQGVGAAEGIKFPESPACGNWNIKHSARFLAFTGPEMWQSGKRLSYSILQTDEYHWGPIEIRLLDNKTTEERRYQGIDKPSQLKGMNVSYWEIEVFPRSCEGIAIKPDGSPTVLSAGDLYMADHYEVEQGMANAKLEIVPFTGISVKDKQECINANRKLLPGYTGDATPLFNKKGVEASNNVFKVKWTKIAYGFEGRCIQWVSNDSFLFLSKNNELCLWKNGVVETLRSAVPSEFCYCNVSPFETATAIEHGNGKTGTDHNSEVAKEARYLGDLKAGYIRTNWSPSKTKGNIVVSLKNVGSPRLLEFCIVQGSDLSRIDPAQCLWQKTNPREKNADCVDFPTSSVLLLRDGVHCSAIRITEVENKKEFTSRPEFVSYEWKSQILDKDSLSPAMIAKKYQPKAKAFHETSVSTSEESSGSTCQLFEIDRGVDFSVGIQNGFSFIKNIGGAEYHSVSIPTPKTYPGFMQAVVIAGKHIEDIDKPVFYFDKPPSGQLDLKVDVSLPGRHKTQRCLVGSVLLVRYSYSPTQIFAVETTEVKSDRVVYKKRFWPGNQPDPSGIASAKEQP